MTTKVRMNTTEFLALEIWWSKMTQTERVWLHKWALEHGLERISQIRYDAGLFNQLFWEVIIKGSLYFEE